MKRKFSPLPEYQEVTIVPMTGTMPVTWRNRHGYTVVERCYSLATQQWIKAHRPNAVVLPTPSGWHVTRHVAGHASGHWIRLGREAGVG